MRIAILYNRPLPAGHPFAESSRDVLDQVQVVESSLSGAGIERIRLEVDGNLETDIAELRRARPDMAFNLVETVNEDPRLFPAMAGMLELLGIPFTGSGSFALMSSTDKNLAKLAFRGANLPTPDWRVYTGEGGFSCTGMDPPWIVKPGFEDASAGIEDSSIYEDEKSLGAALPVLRKEHTGQPLLVETYVEGREFNLSLLENGAGLEVLPVAEIDFSAFPENKPKIVGYRAKWDAASFEHGHTPRRFIGDEDEPPAGLLGSLAKQACRTLGVTGYARVDFRVARDGRPWILEVNANPCLARNAGFMAAAGAAGLTETETIGRILWAAQRRR